MWLPNKKRNISTLIAQSYKRLKDPKSTVASIIVKWRKCRTIRSGGGFAKEVSKNLMVTLAKLQRSREEMGDNIKETSIRTALH